MSATDSSQTPPRPSDPPPAGVLDAPSPALASLGADPDDRTDGLDGYAVKLAVFEGPLDLLLHLIRQNEVDITDIPIQRIAEQYLETIELMQELNLDVAAEYLVMAATLALIKSRMLLPSEEQDEEEGVDPRTELVERLLQYQLFKEAAETLSQRRLLGRDVWSVVGPGPEKRPESEREIEVGLFELVAAFKEVLDQAGNADLKHEVETEQVTVRDRDARRDGPARGERVGRVHADLRAARRGGSAFAPGARRHLPRGARARAARGSAHLPGHLRTRHARGRDPRAARDDRRGRSRVARADHGVDVMEAATP